jgi:hypothetical protein
MDDQRATEILGRYGDYDHMEAELARPGNVTPEQIELAEALAFDWREHGDDPGFNQPGRSLVSEVEAIIGHEI